MEAKELAWLKDLFSVCGRELNKPLAQQHVEGLFLKACGGRERGDMEMALELELDTKLPCSLGITLASRMGLTEGGTLMMLVPTIFGTFRFIPNRVPMTRKDVAELRAWRS